MRSRRFKQQLPGRRKNSGKALVMFQPRNGHLLYQWGWESNMGCVTTAEELADDFGRNPVLQSEPYSLPLGQAYYDREVARVVEAAWGRAEVPRVVDAATQVVAAFLARRNDVAVCGELFAELSRAVVRHEQSKLRAIEAIGRRGFLIALWDRIARQAKSLISRRRAELPVRPPALGQTYYDDTLREMAIRADRRGELAELILSLCDVLGWIVAEYGQVHVMADVIGKLGDHIVAARSRITAQEELEDLKRNGIPIN